MRSTPRVSRPPTNDAPPAAAAWTKGTGKQRDAGGRGQSFDVRDRQVANDQSLHAQNWLLEAGGLQRDQRPTARRTGRLDSNARAGIGERLSARLHARFCTQVITSARAGTSKLHARVDLNREACRMIWIPPRAVAVPRGDPRLARPRPERWAGPRVFGEGDVAQIRQLRGGCCSRAHYFLGACSARQAHSITATSRSSSAALRMSALAPHEGPSRVHARSISFIRCPGNIRPPPGAIGLLRHSRVGVSPPPVSFFRNPRARVAPAAVGVLRNPQAGVLPASVR